MSQHADYQLANQSGLAFRADLNELLLAIASLNSGTAAPATTFPFMLWADTTNTLLKMRNAANSAWVTIGTLDATNLGLLAKSGGTMTGALLIALGTVGAPGIAFSGDSNTGIYSPSADIMGLVAAGVEYLRVSSGGISFLGTGAVTLPSGTTAERPTPANGMARYNSTTTSMEFYVNGNWKAMPAVSAYPLVAADIASDAITTVKILNSNVTTAKIADANVTTAKLDATLAGNIAKAWANVSTTARTGTYTQAGTTVTLTWAAAHNLIPGSIVTIDFTAGLSTDNDGTFTVLTTPTSLTATITVPIAHTVGTPAAFSRTCCIFNGYGFASLSRPGTGAARLTLNTAMSDAFSYNIVVTMNDSSAVVAYVKSAGRTTTVFDIGQVTIAGSAADGDCVAVAVYGT